MGRLRSGFGVSASSVPLFWPPCPYFRTLDPVPRFVDRPCVQLARPLAGKRSRAVPIAGRPTRVRGWSDG